MVLKFGIWILLSFITLVAVCMYCLVMIRIERSETAQKSALEIQDKFSPRQNAVWDKIQSENFFPMVGKIFFSDCICLRLNFVSDYIPQLYFVCNLLIFYYVSNQGYKCNYYLFTCYSHFWMARE